MTSFRPAPSTQLHLTTGALFLFLSLSPFLSSSVIVDLSALSRELLLSPRMHARSVVAVAAALVLAVAVARLPTAAAYVTVLSTGRAYAHRSAEFGPALTDEGVVGTAVSLRSISVGNE